MCPNIYIINGTRINHRHAWKSAPCILNSEISFARICCNGKIYGWYKFVSGTAIFIFFCFWVFDLRGSNEADLGKLWQNSTILRSNKIHHENIPIKFWPLKPHFYTVKLQFTGIYIIFFHFCLKTIDCGKEYPTIYVLSRNMKNIRIFIWKLSVFGGEIFNIFE